MILQLLALALALGTGTVAAQEVPLDLKASFLKFEGHAFLHDFEGQAQSFVGSAQIDLNRPQVVTRARIVIAVAGMTTFQQTRDRNMKTWLQATTQPEIVFTLDQVKLFAGEPRLAREAMPARFRVQGELEMNHQQHPLTGMADGWRSGALLIVSGQTTLNTEDYGLPQIRQLFLTVDPRVDVTYRLAFDLPPALQVSR
jgi:polyisoprenoid-binding protein YceI